MLMTALLHSATMYMVGEYQVALGVVLHRVPVLVPCGVPTISGCGF